MGTVAETGDRQYPVQMGRCGDPINPSIHDYYAISKVFSEFAVFESGLKHWVSIRQTGQYPTNDGAGEEPIIFHQPPNNVLEWSTSIESGICMANICENWVPESFWRKAYNLSSGKGWRFTCWEFTNLMMEGMGMTFADTQDPRRMAKYNFHGRYFSDADALNDILHFRGGEVVSDKMEGVYQPLVWKCAFGHTFKATPNTVLRGGHWCPECQRSEWHYAEIARKNPFYAQVWKPLHGDKHDYHIPMAYSAFDITEKLKKELDIED